MKTTRYFQRRILRRSSEAEEKTVFVTSPAFASMRHKAPTTGIRAATWVGAMFHGGARHRAVSASTIDRFRLGPRNTEG
jgi:hypothetical protein